MDRRKWQMFFCTAYNAVPWEYMPAISESQVVFNRQRLFESTFSTFPKSHCCKPPLALSTLTFSTATYSPLYSTI
jgi:hypothetical protein